jgi:hypothetical protein
MQSAEKRKTNKEMQETKARNENLDENCYVQYYTVYDREIRPQYIRLESGGNRC